MIQAITETSLSFFLQTEDNRIDTSVASSKIRHLVKFTNDMDKSIQYGYSTANEIYDRYTLFRFLYSLSKNVYTGSINLIPAGYYKYEIYEVSWIGTVTVSDGNAPATENDVLTPVADDKGVVKGLVTKGKMYVAEKSGTEQVQYTQRQAPDGTNYIYYGADTWTPSSESSLTAWYKNKIGITLNGSDVSAWADSSTNSHDMVQATASEQPAYNASTGALTFDATAIQNLQTTTQMTFSGEFTIGLRLFPTADNAVVLGDNTVSNEFFKIITSTRLRFKTDGAQRDMDLDSGSLLADNYLVITRDSSNLIQIHLNGVAQSDTETLSGTADIDAIGVRNPDTNPYAGVIKEIQIFNSESSALTTNVNTYLSNL